MLDIKWEKITSAIADEIYILRWPVGEHYFLRLSYLFHIYVGIDIINEKPHMFLRIENLKGTSIKRVDLNYDIEWKEKYREQILIEIATQLKNGLTCINQLLHKTEPIVTTADRPATVCGECGCNTYDVMENVCVLCGYSISEKRTCPTCKSTVPSMLWTTNPHSDAKEDIQFYWKCNYCGWSGVRFSDIFTANDHKPTINDGGSDVKEEASSIGTEEKEET